MVTLSTQAKSSRWDPVVKLTHWSIVLAVLANSLFTEEGSAAHVWVGYALADILALRLLWGMIGSSEARFTAFPPSPRKALTHVREIKAGKVSEHASHNPLGALMVYAIWSCLLVIIGTGIAIAGLPGSGVRHDEGRGAVKAFAMSSSTQSDDDERNEPLDHETRTGNGDERKEGALTEVHEAAANLLYLLILLHIAGVLFETRRSGPQVVLSMLPARR
jgi:cytochrome b